MVNPWPLRVGVTFFEKAESNLKLCIMNKRMRNLQNVICFVVGIFFFFRLETSWHSRIEPLFIQESSRSALSDGSTLKRGCWGRGLGSEADYFGRRTEEGN